MRWAIDLNRVLMNMIFVLFLTGCSIGLRSTNEQPIMPLPTDPNVQIHITSAFGQNQIINQSLNAPLPSVSLLDWMRDHTTIETAYDGHFVNSINGIQSGYTNADWLNRKQMDWFVYRNGTLSDVGANDIPLVPGDQIQWDYHVWNDAMGNDLRHHIGAFPHPFVQSGSNQTIMIFYGKGFEQLASKLRLWLDPYVSAQLIMAETSPDSPLPSERSGPRLWIGLDSQLPNQWIPFGSADSTLFGLGSVTQDTIVRAQLLAVSTADEHRDPLWLLSSQSPTTLSQFTDQVLTATDTWKSWFGVQFLCSTSSDTDCHLAPITFGMSADEVETSQ